MLHCNVIQTLPFSLRHFELAPPSNKRPSYRPQFKISASPRIRPPLLSPCFMEEYWDNRGCIILVVFNHKQVIIDSFKHCELTVATDDGEDLLIHCLKPNRPCAAGLDRSKVSLYYVVLLERQDPSETSEGLTRTYIVKKNRWYPTTILEK